MNIFFECFFFMSATKKTVQKNIVVQNFAKIFYIERILFCDGLLEAV